MPDADTTAWVNAVVSDGGSVSGTQQGYVDNLVVALKGLSAWTPLVRLWLYAGESDAHQAKIDVRNLSSHTLTVAPTLSAGGYQGNGTTQFINTGYNPITASLDPATFAAGCYNTADDAGGGNGVFFGENTGGHFYIQPNSGGAGGTFDYTSNSFPSYTAAATGYKGQYAIWGTDATHHGLDQNEANIALAGTSSGTFGNLPIFTLGYNGSGSLTQASAVKMGAFWVVSDSTIRTKVANVVNQYMKAWTIEAYPSAPLYTPPSSAIPGMSSMQIPIFVRNWMVGS